MRRHLVFIVLVLLVVACSGGEDVPTTPLNRGPTVELLASPTSGQAPLTVTYTVSANDPDGDALSYVWTFPENETRTGQEMRQETYEEAGTYIVTVKVSDGKGGVASDSVSVSVAEPATDELSVALAAVPTKGNAPLTVSFAAVASGTHDDSLSYTWNFGTGDTVTGERERSYTYNTPGTYLATVTVTDGEGSSADASVSITVDQDVPPPSENRPPTVELKTNKVSGTTPLDVSFTTTAADPNNDTLKYTWDFGDGTTAVGGIAQTHTYTASGTFTATVVVTDGRGGSAQDSVEITTTPPPPENAPPTVALEADKTEGTVPLDVSFSATASDPNGDTLSYTWDFGDGVTVATGSTQTHTYTDAGTFTATVIVADGRGGSAQDSVKITTTPPESAPPADSFTVNNTTTDSDINPGNGVCETGVGNGVCTLTAAIQETNALEGRQTINVPEGVYTATSPKALPLLIITDALTVVGAGPELSVITRGPDEGASVVIEAGASVEIRNVGIFRRFVGIRNNGELLLVDSTVAAEDDYGRVSTFGIINTGTATVRRSEVGEGRNTFSIGISNSGSLTVFQSSVFNNGAEGIVNGGTLRVEDSIIGQNNIIGIVNYDGAEAVILRSAIANNGGSSEDCGSGISNGGTLTLTNSTVSGSRTINYGAGVCNGIGISNGNGKLTLVNSTITDNGDDEGPTSSIYNRGVVEFTNTIIANTLSSTECGGPGTFTSNGNNLASDATCRLTQPSDLSATDPLLGPLAYNGGSTLTHALLPGSPAIDAGSDTGLATDQRGVLRPQGDGYDIGAYEVKF